jgi:oligopeptide transport system substrate-binding protein
MERDLKRLAEDRLAEPYAALETAVAAADWDEALRLVEEIKDQDPNYRDVLALEEQAVSGQQRAQQATWAVQWREQAETALAGGDVASARVAAQRWRQMTPDDPDAAAFLEKLDGPPPEAGPVTEESEIEAEIAALYEEMRRLLEEEEWAEAIETADAILALDPDYADTARQRQKAAQAQQNATRVARLQALLDAEKWSEAINYADKALKERFDYRIASMKAQAESALGRQKQPKPSSSPRQAHTSQAKPHPPSHTSSSTLPEGGSSGRNIWLWVGIGAIVIVMAICATPTIFMNLMTPEVVTEEVVVTQVVTEIVEVEGDPVEVTRVVQETVVEEVEVTRVLEETREEETVSGANISNQPVTLNINLDSEPPTLDPSLATDTTSVDVIRNLFVTLTQLDPITGEVQPYLATEWETDENSQTWTFTLRNDILWVQYNPSTGDIKQLDFVTAYDVEYGVKRTLDPETASDYSYVLYIIENGRAFNTGESGVTINNVGVEALNNTTLQFTLEEPAPYFPSIASMWIAAPQPQAAIEERPDRWIEAGFIVTNGPMVLDTWSHGSELILVKNPFWPEASTGTVQIERVEALIIEEASISFAMYENNELDTAVVPLPEGDRVKADPILSEEFVNAPQPPCTYYYGFTNNKPPFDSRSVRQAFVQSIDRQSLIDNVTKGGQIPATSFAPPGIFGAPEPGQVGLEYDPEAAQAALQEYLDEQGMTLEEFNNMGITLMHNTSEGHAQIAAAIQQMWQDTLGVDVQVENQEWRVYLNTLRYTTPLEEMPHIWRLGWCADYADENNWVHEVFNAEAGANRLRRNCLDPNCNRITSSEFDELTVEAQQEQDPEDRIEMYHEAERILAEDEAAYAPIYHYTTLNVTKPWLTRNFPPLGGNDWFNWVIDQEAKLETIQ